MRLTLVHPAIGRRPGQEYIRTWQMEPLPPALIAGLTPRDVEVRFYDDRMEAIPFDEPTDLVAMSVETYTARRAYQIASEFRRRSVPVVMGGFHPTLCPEEAASYAESVVVGEAERLWPLVLDDYRHKTPRKIYRQEGRPDLRGARPDRRIFRGKRYLPIGLVEAGRGCHFKCDFCAVQTVFGARRTHRPADEILAEVASLATDKPLIFFVDDNVTSNVGDAKAFFRDLIPLGVRWVSQASINVAHDEEFLDLLRRSGCQGLLVGFESLNAGNLEIMNKRFNLARSYETAIENFRRFGIRLYATFVFGYDLDSAASFAETVDFAIRHRFYITAFNHLTPFPGTDLYRRLESEGRMLFPAWWLDDGYSYNKVPFQPRGLTPEEVEQGCVDARRRFYSWGSIARRSVDPATRASLFMFRNYFLINALHRADVNGRNHYPLGEAGWRGPLMRAE